MKAQDLRIGNYVYLCNDFCHLTSILSPNKTNGYMVEIWINGPVKTKLENIKPIPLDEEWMVKLGFNFYKSAQKSRCYQIKRGSHKTQNFRTFNLYQKKDGFGINASDGYEKCVYVHQLQNLYFALTGEELTLQK